MKKLCCVVCAIVCIFALGGCGQDWEDDPPAEKPVIYLYPEETTQVSVKLELDGELTASWPPYGEGWRVTARPDGTLLSGAEEYSYLFWEGTTGACYDLSCGFVVKGENTGEFLRNALQQMGLTSRESNEFIAYWLPRMQDNAYNLISFQQEEYTDHAVLTVEPQPDSVLRVFMVWKPLEQPAELAPQELPAFERSGFALVEWGGAELK